jgi:NAD(P)-dependent dehydrogenase (short-subunit alcohol dehydrogenase family)
LVTGGANGIGRECALIASAQGARVVVNDFGGGFKGGDEGSPAPAEAVAQEIRNNGGEAVANSDSVTSLKAVEGMLERALDTFGALHGVINTAGILRDRIFHKMTQEDWDSVVEVHLRGSFNVCRASIGHFRDRREGAYVLFTSGAGLFGNVGQANYASAKMGIVGLSRVIAMEGANHNIRSNCIAPLAWTRMMASVPARDADQEAQLKTIAQSIRPDQPARFAVALLAPEAAHVSGQIFGVWGEKIGLYSQPRLIEKFEMPEGESWTVESLLKQGLPGMAPKFTSLEPPTL